MNGTRAAALGAGATAAAAAGVAVFLGQYPTMQVYGPTIHREREAGRRFALTYDDGPNPEQTPRLLDLLARHDAHATFFLIGKWTEETLGLEWFSEVTLFQKLNDRTGIAWQNYVTGASDAEVDLQRFGARAIMRRQMTPSWLFLEVRAGVGWPRMKEEEKREASIEAGIAFEMQFSDGSDD